MSNFLDCELNLKPRVVNSARGFFVFCSVGSGSRFEFAKLLEDSVFDFFTFGWFDRLLVAESCFQNKFLFVGLQVVQRVIGADQRFLQILPGFLGRHLADLPKRDGQSLLGFTVQVCEGRQFGDVDFSEWNFVRGHVRASENGEGREGRLTSPNP